MEKKDFPSRNQAITKALRFIHKNYGDPHLNVREIAGHVGMKEKSFLNLFRREMKTNPMKFLTSVRIKNSKDYLEKSDLSFKEIAIKMGFRDYLTYRNYFRKIEGMAPDEFRKRINYTRVIKMKEESTIYD